MRPSISFLPLPLFLFFLISFHGATARGIDLIHKTCRKSAKKDPNLRFDFCVTSLEADPKSHCADLQELGVISMELALANATHTRSHAKKLLKHKKLDPYTKACLHDCFDLYSDAIPTLKQAIKDYNSKRYFDANIKMSSAMDDASTCEEGFKEKKGVVSPLTKRNNNMFQLSAIALSIINMVNSLS
ncbi:hypothetical protein HHK36_028574 [Tetracentron sinense]|uniref:Pectinesterase inhibitor domain-containing protein n=1 Tax=Tetracentron sinense TaxID=13715 RepID=A0A834YF98_TETSI|nr:hypothetical protein HHK36_028574 [Tetracentron sinense]